MGRLKTLGRKLLTGPTAVRLARTRQSREWFFLTAPNFTSAVLSEVGDCRFFVATTDRTIGREVFMAGSFDRQEIEQAFATIDRFGIPLGRTLLEIGSNIGTTSIPLVKSGRFDRAIAIEPEPFNFALLGANVAINAMVDRFTCIHAAVSDQSRPLIFEICDVNHGDHRVRVGAAAAGDLGENGRATIEVTGTTIDDLVARNRIRLDEISLAFIDTQGHEFQVLSGASKLLESSIPLILEYWPYALRRANGLEGIESLIARHFSRFVDLRNEPNATIDHAHSATDIKRLRDVGMTDLLLLH